MRNLYVCGQFTQEAESEREVKNCENLDCCSALIRIKQLFACISTKTNKYPTSLRERSKDDLVTGKIIGPKIDESENEKEKRGK